MKPERKQKPLLAIETVARGLKCDADGCGYVEPSIKLTRKSVRASVGKPCPRCGANLCTEKDARTMIAMMNITTGINIIFFPFMVLHWIYRAAFIRKDPEIVVYRAHMNGSGHANIRRKEPCDQDH